MYVLNSSDLISSCNGLLGNALLHYRNDFPNSNLGAFENNYAYKFVLKPKIVITDESLRSLSPEK